MKQLLLYLDASECIVSQTQLSCGFCPMQVTTMLEIPGVVTPMVEGTVRRRKHLITDASQDESPQKKACAESSSVAAPVADDNVSETASTDKQVTSVTESVTTMTSATDEQVAAETQDSEKSEKNRHIATCKQTVGDLHEA